MSKSLGNVIDPLEMTEKYGADATRLSLIIGAPPGSDIKLSEDKVRGYKYFANKLWNIARFVLLQTEDYPPRLARSSGEAGKPSKKIVYSAKDKAILKEFQAMAKEITKDIEEWRLYLAAEKLYHYVWHTFADKVLEESKEVLQDKKARASRQAVLLHVLTDSLKLLHPFTPFVTEALYQKLPLKNKKKTLMIESWPV